MKFFSLFIFYFESPSLRFVFMRPQTFEFLKKFGISQITFFRKVKETNVPSKNFSKYDFAHFVI